MRSFLCMLIVGLVALPARAAVPVVDGTLDASYGAATAVQDVQTGFGDANLATATGGSELDAGYATISGGRLYVMLTGNLEPNLNKLEVFFDSKSGGENKLTATPQYDYFDGAKWISSNMQGLTFDSDFSADYHLYARWGGGNATPGPFEVDFVNRNGGGSALVPASSGTTVNPTVGGIASGSIPAGNVANYNGGLYVAPSSALTQNLDFAINDNNTAGVSGGLPPFVAADTTAAAAVTTGMEFSIALADLGSPAAGSTIKIAAMVNGSNHDYLSNQILGPLPLSDATDPPSKSNLGGTGDGAFTGDLSLVDFNQFAGQQYFTITVPSATGVPGDYNGNGTVDAADYVMWREHLGQTFALQNRDPNNNSGPISQNDYTYWKSRFGATSGSGALGTGAVPEPASIVLLGMGFLLSGRMLRRRS